MKAPNPPPMPAPIAAVSANLPAPESRLFATRLSTATNCSATSSRIGLILATVPRPLVRSELIFAACAAPPRRCAFFSIFSPNPMTVFELSAYLPPKAPPSAPVSFCPSGANTAPVPAPTATCAAPATLGAFSANLAPASPIFCTPWPTFSVAVPTPLTVDVTGLARNSPTFFAA